jgi:hypothetical protein
MPAMHFQFCSFIALSSVVGQLWRKVNRREAGEGNEEGVKAEVKFW